MNDPGLFTVPADWREQTGIQNVLSHVRGGHPVGLVEVTDTAQEVFAVIVPIEQYRRMVLVEPA